LQYVPAANPREFINLIEDHGIPSGTTGKLSLSG
jgi:hypothetical protein